MSNWLVELRSGSATERLELWDSFGPLNDFRFQGLGTFNPAKGNFTNQTANVVPSLPNSWVLRGLDIDATRVGASGDGEVFDSGGSFPDQVCRWVIVKQLY